MQMEFLGLTDNEAIIDQEQWKPVAGFPRYEVSTMGRFRNKATGKFARGTVVHNGYVHIGLSRNGTQITKLAHRLIAETWLEKPSLSHSDVNHKNKSRADNRLPNLEWSTRSHNSRHSKQR